MESKLTTAQILHFWHDWGNITVLEREKIQALQEFQAYLIDSFSPEDLSAYTGGSFIRREYANNSDIDVWIAASKEKLPAVEQYISKYLDQHPTVAKALDHPPSYREWEKVMGVGQEPDYFFRAVTLNGAHALFGKVIPPIEVPPGFYAKTIKGMLQYLEDKRKTGNPWIQNVAKFILYIGYFELAEKEPEIEAYSFRLLHSRYSTESLIHQVTGIMLSPARVFNEEMTAKMWAEIERLNRKYLE